MSHSSGRSRWPSVALAVLILGASLHISGCSAQNVTAAAAHVVTPPPRVKLEWESIFVLVAIVLMIFFMAINAIGSLAALFITSLIFRLAGIITTPELFAGFVNKGMLVIALFFVLVHPISHLPIARNFVSWLLRPAPPKYKKDDAGNDTEELEEGQQVADPVAATLWPRAKLCFTAWIVSPLLENVPHVAVMTTVVARVCRDFGFPPSLLLLPMAFSTCSSNWLAIGSASNLIIQSLQEEAGYEPIGFFELIKTNGPVSLILQLYFIFLTPFLLRSNLKPPGEALEGGASFAGAPAAVAPGAASISAVLGQVTVGAHDTVAMLVVPSLATARYVDDASPSSGLEGVGDTSPDGELAGSELTAAAKQPHASIGRSMATVLASLPDAVRAGVRVVGLYRERRDADSGQPVTPHGATDVGTEWVQHVAPETIVEAGDILVVLGEPRRVRAVRQLGNFYYGAVTARCGTDGLGLHGESTALRTEPVADSEPVSESARGATADAASSFDARAAAQPGLPEPVSMPPGLCPIPMRRNPAPFALVVVADEAHGVGQQLRTNAFTSAYNCAVLSCRTHHGEHLAGPGLSMHVLTAGDRLVLRVKPEFIMAFANGPSTEFYMVEPVGLTVDNVLQAKYVRVPGCLAGACVSTCGKDRVLSRGGDTYFRLPDWWENLTFLTFLAVVAAAMAEQDLLVAAGVAIAAMVILGLITVKQAVNFVEWNVYVTGSFAFGIGSAMSNSGLAAWCGQLLVDAGVEGVWMMIILGAITGLIANIVSNRGAIQVMFPIAVAITNMKGHDLTPYAVTIANTAMAGFITPYGLSPSLIVAGPGDYVPRDYLVFGTPLLVLYVVLSAVMSSIVYGFW